MDYKTPEQILTKIFEEIPHHRRLYADSVVPVLLAGLKAAGRTIIHADCGGSEHCGLTYADDLGILCRCKDAL